MIVGFVVVPIALVDNFVYVLYEFPLFFLEEYYIVIIFI